MNDAEMAVSDSSESPTTHIFLRLMVRLSEQYIRSQRKREARSGDCEAPSGCVAEWTGDDSYFLTGGGAADSRPPKRLKAAATATATCSTSDATAATAEASSSRLRWIPDELLTGIFRHIPSARDRSVCASVCKRWLMLQTRISRSDFDIQESASEESDCVVSQPSSGEPQPTTDWKLEKQPLWAIGDLCRSLEGKKATDLRLASIAVGTGAHGGLGKLTIRGGLGERSAKGVTDEGLSAIGTCCNALRSLTLWDCPNVGDNSLKSIGSGCRLLETLDILKCPNIGNAGLQAIAAGCLRLSSLSIESCPGVGNTGLKAIAENCSNLLTVNLSKCSGIGNSGVIGLIQHCKSLRKLKLEKITVTDTSLSFISHHGKSLTKLVLSSLDKVTEKGFVTFSLQSGGLKSLKVLVLNSCKGVTDIFMASFGTTPRELKVLRLIDCEVSDHGLQALLNGCHSLKGLHVEKCNRITYIGLQTFVGAVSETLKTLHISKCAGIQDSSLAQGALEKACKALTSLSVTYCEGVGDRCLGLLPSAFPSLEHLDLSGITHLSDQGLSAFLENSGTHLLSLNLRDCIDLTDEAVLAVGRKCWNLQVLVLDGCAKVTERSISFLTSQCTGIQELDISRCDIGDAGVMAVVLSIGPCLKTLSLAGCSRVTDESLPVIRKLCDSLSALNMKNCSSLTAGALESFEAELQRCDVLWP